VNGQTYTIRLDGIDAPEGGQAFGREARVQLRVLAFSKPATATVLDRDRYGRTVARVIVAGRDLSEEMVRAGLAWHFVRYSADRRLAALEQEARQQRRGLWADRASLPPWQYRSDRGTPPNVTPPPLPPAAPLSAGPYHGNVSSRVYHAVGCPDYNCRNCTHVFSSRREAEAAGYRPHNTCVVARMAVPGEARTFATGANHPVAFFGQSTHSTPRRVASASSPWFIAPVVTIALRSECLSLEMDILPRAFARRIDVSEFVATSRLSEPSGR
jgi:hypothetical protein